MDLVERAIAILEARLDGDERAHQPAQRHLRLRVLHAGAGVDAVKIVIVVVAIIVGDREQAVVFVLVVIVLFGEVEREGLALEAVGPEQARRDQRRRSHRGCPCGTRFRDGRAAHAGA